MRSSSSTSPIWIDHFFRVALGLALGAVLVAAFSGWKQEHAHHADMISDITVDLGGKPVREHCNTCHVYFGASISKDHGLSHPDIAPHSLEKLGCTGCHLGEGMAFDPELSHGLPGYGARKVLKGKDLQASCYRCHELKPLKGAEQAWKGYELFATKPCGTCHRLAMLKGGGYFCPDLSEIGSYLGLEKLYEAVRNPKREPVNSIMPRFPLSRSQAIQITYFLKSQVKDPFHVTPMILETGRMSPSIPELISMVGTDKSGMGLLKTLKCTGCHKFDEEDGQISPDLSFIRRMRTQDYLDDFVLSPAKLIPGAIMPIIAMDADKKAILISFLLTGGASKPEHQGHSDSKSLYMTLCQRCHAAAGDGFGIIQPNLANFPRAFANNAPFFRRISDKRIMASLSWGIPGTSMPPYGQLLSDSERNDLMDLVFSSFVGVNRMEKDALKPLATRPPVAASPDKGETLFQKHCLRCHGQAGTGTGPEYLKYLPKPRNLRNSLFFTGIENDRIARSVYDGVLGTAMPAFRDKIKPSDLWLIVEKVRQFSGKGERGGKS
jgi:mono/diheme cytochrome c family protein/cbb3-type cytochrome oxidase cytochrome c subunit